MGSIDLSMKGVIATGSMTLALLVRNSIDGNNLGLAGMLAPVVIGLCFGLLNGVLITYGQKPSTIVTLAM
jgi:ribose transport system permease protein